MNTKLYRIGAVSKLTGITVECLRAWERRHGLEPAERAGKTRFYSVPQIERLKKIRTLLDQGHAISQLINLPTKELDSRVAIEPGKTISPASRSVGLVGPNLILAEREEPKNRLNVQSRWANIETLETQLETIAELDVLVIQVPSLDLQLVEKFCFLVKKARLIIAYQYATKQDLEDASMLDVGLIAWPADWSDIEYLCLSQAGRVERSSTRRFTDAELIQIATAIPQASCSCPRNLVELITDLSAFAVHAERCALTNNQHPITASTAEATRAELERNLEAFVEQYRLLTHAN